MLNLSFLRSDQAIAFFVRTILIFTALPLHEFAHAFVAHRLGDPTAKQAGRLTLNPMRHLDKVGTLMLLFVGFGFAKPVPVSPHYFKNPRKGMALTALAGPLSNLLFAYLLMVAFRILIWFRPVEQSQNSILVMIFFYGVAINIMLAVFNLIPIPPLDGSRVIDLFLPLHLSQRWHTIEYRYGNFLIGGLMIGIWVGALAGPLIILQNVTWRALWFLTGYIDFFAQKILA